MDGMDFTFTKTSSPKPGDKTYDVAIVGGGPGGLTAALYCGRYRIDTIMIEKEILSGGQMTTTEWVENYPGFEDPVLGNQLAKSMESQVQSTGVSIVRQTVTKLSLKGSIKEIQTGAGTIKARSIIISTGASARLLGIPGEETFRGKGVSYCATCDGPFYPDKTIAVVGGGNTALEESLFLAKYAGKIYLIHRRDAFRGDKIIQERIFKEDRIEIWYNTVVKAIRFEDENDRHIVFSKKEKEEKLRVDGIFIFIGMVPNNDLFKGAVDTDEEGWVITDCDMKTNVPGVFAVGDVRQKNLRQIATAVGDGALAAYSANKYLDE